MGDTDDGLREQVQALREVIRVQGERLVALERALATHDEAANDQTGADHAVVVGDGTTDRRHLLSKAATVAAGAVVGGTALALGQVSPAAALQGVFDGNPAVVATSNLDTAVWGSGQAIGVEGVSGAGYGVLGVSQTGYPVCARASGDNAYVKAHLILESSGGIVGLPVPPTRTDAHTAGEIALDLNNDLWLCVTSGTPGRWRRVSGAGTAGALSLLSTPVRVYDSRPGNPPDTGPKTPLGGGVRRTVDCQNNGSGVPADATGVLVNVTVVNTSSTGFLVACKYGSILPTASTINWYQPGTIVANTTVVACGGPASIDCYVPSRSSTDFFIDVIGYFR